MMILAENWNELKPCPICGAPAFLTHDWIDSFDFGWSVGCPKYRNYDGIHGHDENTPDELRLSAFGFISKETAMQEWNHRVKTGRWREGLMNV